MTKNKHDHKASKKLKSLIFGIMLLLPFIFLLPTGIYYALNQTATQSNTIEQQPIYYQSNEVNTCDDLISGNIYYFNLDGTTYTQTSTIVCNYLQIIEGTFTTYSFTLSQDLPYFVCPNNSSDTRVFIDNNTIGYVRGNGKLAFVYETLISFDNNLLSKISYCDMNVISSYTTITTTNSVSTSVINAWNDTWSNPLFSWADSSPFNNAINGFTNVFNIQVENHINTMLAYEFSIIAIYVVFDIVIELFICLTHIIPRSD